MNKHPPHLSIQSFAGGILVKKRFLYKDLRSTTPGDCGRAGLAGPWPRPGTNRETFGTFRMHVAATTPKRCLYVAKTSPPAETIRRCILQNRLLAETLQATAWTAGIIFSRGNLGERRNGRGWRRRRRSSGGGGGGVGGGLPRGGMLSAEPAQDPCNYHFSSLVFVPVTCD